MEAKIFINYCRKESAWNSVALYQELVKHFPKKNVFKDFNTIDPGTDFVEQIEGALSACDVLLVMIGSQWLQMKDEKGNQRIFKEDDFVRLEIATALQRNIRVIPVLFDDAVLPTSEELPDDLKKLSRRQSIAIDNNRFEEDTARLIDVIKRSLPNVKGDITKTIVLVLLALVLAEMAYFVSSYYQSHTNNQTEKHSLYTP